jgi:hypothetical protein
MPHFSFTSPSTSWTQTKQINQYARHSNSRSTILCSLHLLLLLLQKFCPWSMNSVPLHTNPQDFFAGLWTITQWWRNLWQSNGYHWTLTKPRQPIKNDLTLVAHLWTPVGGGRQTMTWSTSDIYSNGANGFTTRIIWKSFHCITGIRKIGTIHTTTVIPTISLSCVITTVSVLLMWRNGNKQRPIRLSRVWRSTCFPFVITTPTFGYDWESYCCQRWRRWYWQSVQLPKLSWGAIDIHYPYVAAVTTSNNVSVISLYSRSVLSESLLSTVVVWVQHVPKDRFEFRVRW